ncbi:FAD-dependent monooxygenase [Oceanomicrobium pacificus]|uniref:NAD(P)-binding protein n=1 Tax=Oceanomicrobium pacificus TaxID=2692916 RepID=A0A6B0TNP0_9RHOB|nr:FAD-dependent monooxygenase [Oceanomicrobium pacificus]MXU65486.1 NAD(P)-binding protein [Oceanomicrobium pacificus]
MSGNRSITVLGGGIGGLAAAIALARRGCAVDLIEQADALSEVGAGLQISPNGVAVLEGLGLRDAVAVVAGQPEAVHLRDGRSGRRVATVPLGRQIEMRHGRPFWQIHRADLVGILADAARREGVSLQLGRRITGIARDDGTDGPVLLKDAAGQTSTHGTLVAADGVRSRVRAALFGGEQVRFTGQVAWRGLVPMAALPAPLPDAAQVFMGAGRHLVAYPLRGRTLANIVAVEERADWTEESWTRGADPADVRAAFAGWAPEVSALLDALQDCFVWGLFDHPPLRDWASGRVALLGDACHPMLPFMAQGATMALEDAWVLAAELAGSPDDHGAALRAYSRARLARATRVQATSAGNAKIYHMGSGPARQILHGGMRLVGRSAPGLLERKFDWIYGADVTRTHP